MSRNLVATLLVAAAAGVLLLAALLPPRVGHPVTPFMDSWAADAADRRVTSLAVDPHRPLVVVFVLPECPCSLEYEPFVQRLHRAYGEQAAFVEVVAGDDAAAAAWKQERAAPYRIASDFDRRVAKEFGALRSAYTALVLRGRIVKLWPGYSADMLRELAARIAAATGAPLVPLDLDGAPDRPTSGCPL